MIPTNYVIGSRRLQISLAPGIAGRSYVSDLMLEKTELRITATAQEKVHLNMTRRCIVSQVAITGFPDHTNIYTRTLTPAPPIKNHPDAAR